MPRPLVLLATLLAASVSAQPQEVLFPGQTGAELRAALRAAYRPASTTADNDDLYATIDRATVDGQDGVVGVYTGYFVPFDGVPNDDPSQDVFNGGAGINQEHTWPQSLLSGNAVDDYHHIFPTQVQVNADRGNLRFAEIPDDQTDRWYRGEPPYLLTSPPLAFIDEYSELRTGQSFEPREDHGGNVARALFYIATMYDAETNSAFPFNAAQQATLYDWHYQDPIDQAEYDRSFRVAAFQRSASNEPLPNPFVLDSTLVRRAFFPEIPTATEPALPAEPIRLTAAPNPFRASAALTLTLDRAQAVRVEVFDALGRRVARLHDGPAPAGRTTLTVDGAAIPPGLYLVRVVTEGGTLTRRLVRSR